MVSFTNHNDIKLHPVIDLSFKKIKKSTRDHPKKSFNQISSPKPFILHGVGRHMGTSRAQQNTIHCNRSFNICLRYINIYMADSG